VMHCSAETPWPWRAKSASASSDAQKSGSGVTGVTVGSVIIFSLKFGLSTMLTNIALCDIICLMTRKPAQPTGVLVERQKTDGRRRLALTKRETKELRKQRLAEKAATLFLDIDTHRSWSQMASELGITVYQMRELVKSREFDDAYNLMFPEVGHDPRFQAARGQLGDMVPIAIGRLKGILEDGQVSANVVLKAVQAVFELNNLDNKGAQSERFELNEFLKGMKTVNIENLNIVPPEFAAELVKISTVVDGEVVEQADTSEIFHAPLLPALTPETESMMVLE
jgi:hypothetical protein